MLTGTVAFLAGVVLFQQLENIPTLPVWVCITPALAALVHKRLRPAALLVTGFCWAWLVAESVLDRQLPVDLVGEDVVIEGTVASIPADRGRAIRFLFDISRLGTVAGNTDSAPSWRRTHPGRVRLTWYGPAVRLRAGDAWQLQVRLKQPHGYMNPGGFDYEAWLFSHRIRATGYVRKSTYNRPSSPSGERFSLGGWRQGVAERLDHFLADAAHGGVLKALAIGERNEISAAQWTTFTATGTSHLVAISGLHIGLVAGWVFFLARWLWSRPGYSVRLVPATKVGAVAALGAAGLYAAISGFSVPTQRAFVMAAVVFTGQLAQRQIPPSHILAAALSAVLLLDPLSVIAPGFWLSFAAVAVILYAVTGRASASTRWLQWGRVQYAVFVGLLPLLLLFFARTSLIAPVANLIAIPVVSLVVVPCVLVGTLFMAVWPTFAAILFTIADRVLGVLWGVLSWLAEIPGALWTPPAASTAALALALGGVVVMLAPRGLPARWLGAVLCLPAVLMRPAGPVDQDVWVTLLDVGQGLAVVVQTAQRVLVYDTGPRYGDRFDTGRAVVVPFLRHRGVEAIDVLVISHGDSDHIGGADSVLQSIPVGRLYDGTQETTLADYGSRPCRAGDEWSWDGVVFEFLHPEPDRRYSSNNGSCVLRIRSPAGVILLPGDIEAEVERRLVDRLGEDLAADVLVVPHHGSATSSVAGFLARVQPQVALFPTGYRNRFGFPVAGVVERYRAAGVRIFDTSSVGAITVKFTGTSQKPDSSSYRQQRRRYWHHGARGAVVRAPHHESTVQ